MGEKILFVDDEPAALDGYQRMLYRDFQVSVAVGGEEGLAAIRDHGPFAIVVSDMRMPGMTGAEFLGHVRKVSPDSVRMLLTGYSDMDSAVQAVNDGHVFFFLTKPCKKEALQLAINTGLAQYRLRSQELQELSDAKEEVRSLAFYDPLTGLPNRRMLLARLAAATKATEAGNQLRALLFVDMDHFRQLNDSIGYESGDRLLQEMARRLASCARPVDHVTRLSGDKFVVVLEDLGRVAAPAAAKAESVAKRIAVLAAKPFSLGGRICRSSCSIGITIFGESQETSETVLQQADTAVSQAKSAGAGSICFFSAEVRDAAQARAGMVEDLRKGIEGHEFVLHYQPKLDCGVVIGAEALLRWKHPERGMLQPGAFISLAEQTGLILGLGKIVLDYSCQQIAKWSRTEATSGLSIAANISSLQLRQPDFVASVLDSLERAGADPRRLKLEITESTLVDNIDDAIAKMTELKDHGLEFSLDDFGTGYSSLSYLRRLPLDQLKIDRSFVGEIEADASRAIALSIISLGAALGLSVIAEGVETEEQRVILANLGCHAYQGYLCSAPVPVERFERLLEERSRRASLPADILA
jgi:diguanylate cyclase (GGDEF)-like protein